MDRGYVDYARLRRIGEAGAFFVIRAKSNMRFYVIESRPVERSSGLRCDQTIRLNTSKGKREYPDRLRRIRYVDPETGNSLVFITNNFSLSAMTVAQIYKCRWRIELFFKWIKQNLRIKAFFGTSENAVKTQIWIAICVYLMVAILKKSYRLPQEMSQVLQVLSVSVFLKEPFNEQFMNLSTREEEGSVANQLEFNGF